jgi:hypothetical protein
MRIFEILNKNILPIIEDDDYMNEMKSFFIDQLVSMKSQGVNKISVDRALQILTDNGYDVDRNFVTELLDELTDVGTRDGEEFSFSVANANMRKQKKGKGETNRDHVQQQATKKAVSDIFKEGR